MNVTVRFAPSPTGRLHIGNVRAALVNWLYARARGGQFLLRLDDTDKERSSQAYADAIETDLRWLGLNWDRFARQSDRLARYEAAAAQLKAVGRLYPCYETPEDLERRRALQLARRLPPIYDRAALKLSDAEKARFEAEGRKPHWRFLLQPGTTRWHDLIRGEVEIDAGTVSDPVLIRADGTPLYTFCSVVDDIDHATTHIIRGEDHVTNTLSQIQLFAALGAAPPEFAHFALLIGASGEGLSKRDGSIGLAELRDGGIEAMAVNSLIARLGSADPVVPQQGLSQLVDGFDLQRLGRAAARFDPVELKHLSQQILHHMPYALALPRLEALGVPPGNEAFWLAVRGNLEQISDASSWWQIVSQPTSGILEDQAYLTIAKTLLPPEPWDKTTWQAWTAAIKAQTGYKGRALFHPLRLAVTGRENGPDLSDLLPLIGRPRVLSRLSGECA